MKFFTVFLCASFISTSVFAEEAKMTPIQEKQSSPYSGVLLSPEAVAELVTDFVTKEEEKNIAVTRAVGETRAQCTFHETEVRISLEADKKVVQAQLDGAKAQNELLNRELKKAEERQSSPLLWASLGVAAGIVTTVAISFALKNK